MWKQTHMRLRQAVSQQARRLSSAAGTSSSSSANLRVSLFRVGGAAAVLLASGFGVVTVACAADPNNKKVEAPNASAESGTGWRGWLPHSHPTARSDQYVPTIESIEAAQLVLDEAVESHVGGHIAERGIGRKMESLTLSLPAAQEIARDERLQLPIEHAIITKAPKCPPPINRKHPVLLKVALETTAKVMQLTNRLKYTFWTFNDMCPGPMIRGRVGDVVELTLTNTDETGNPHNIDCHGFEGPGGGAPITTAQQGEAKVARFKLLYPGLFVYHCAAAPVPAHIMNGMYGLMLVESEDHPLPKVDREYCVVQSEFYHEPLDNTGGNCIVEPSYPRGLDETADVVVFNGKEGALTTDAPLQAKTGEHVRIYFGNAGPNLWSAFHVIGGIFEKVWRDGDLITPPARFIQTVGVPPGGSTVVDLHPVVPGTYTLVDHAIFRLDKGAVGYMNVTGKERPDLYSGGDPAPCPGCKLHP